MASVWKDLLSPGRVHVGRRVRVFTAQDLENAATQGNRMLASGRGVAAIWEHPPDAFESLSQAERASLAADRARNVFGWASQFRVQNGRLQGRLDDLDNDDIKRLRKVRYCSPRLHWDFVDEDGQKWPGMTVQHIAATPYPVQRLQDPWDLSRGGQNVGGTVFEAVNLSFASAVEFSMADEATTPEPEEKTEPDAANQPSEETESGGKTSIADVVAALATCGVNLGPDAEGITDWDALAHRIIAASHTKSGDAGDTSIDDELDYEDEQDNAVKEESTPPMVMSMAAQKLGREKLVAQIRARCRRKNVPSAIRDKLIRKITGTGKNDALELSFNSKGEMRPNAITEALELLDSGLYSDPAKKGAEDLSRGRIAEQQPPDYLSADGKKRDEDVRRRARADAEKLSVGPRR